MLSESTKSSTGLKASSSPTSLLNTTASDTMDSDLLENRSCFRRRVIPCRISVRQYGEEGYAIKHSTSLYYIRILEK